MIKKGEAGAALDKLRVLIADDTVIYRKILARAVEETGLAVVERSASNGAIAMEWLEQGQIDVALLDLFMPEMDGIETLKAIKKKHPSVDAIMISSLSTDNAQVTLEALKLGALDFIIKPSEASYEKSMDKISGQLKVLFAQIKITKYNTQPRVVHPEKPVAKPPAPANTENKSIKDAARAARFTADVVVIASSTGGPAALESLFAGFLPGFRKPALIVQHMPPEFTRILADSLDRKYPLKVIEGKEGDPVRNGQAIIAPGGLHMEVQPSGVDKTVKLSSSPYVNGVRPAADVLFSSVAKAYEGRNVLAVVLTGMGNDGTRGVQELKEKCNCLCIAQSESSCVVYGMPRCVIEAGLADEVLDLRDIAGRIQQLI